MGKDVSNDKVFITKETTTTGISTNIDKIVKDDLTDPSDNNFQHSGSFKDEAKTKDCVKGKETSRMSNHGEVFEEKFADEPTAKIHQPFM